MPHFDVRTPDGVVAVASSSFLGAVARVLRDVGTLDAGGELSWRVVHDGWEVSVDGQVWSVQTVRREAGRRDVLAALLKALSKAPDVSTAAQLALKAAHHLMAAESGAVLIEEGNYLRFVAATGPHAARLERLRLPRDTGVAGWVAQRGRGVVVGDAAAHPRHAAVIDQLIGQSTRSVVAVPVRFGRSASGVLEMMNPPDGAFSARTLTDLEAVARQLAAWRPGVSSPTRRR